MTGAFAVLLIDGKIVKIPVKELAEKLVPEVPQKSSESLAKAADKLAPKVAETVAVEVNGTLKSFPRAEFIRQLHEGWSASAAKTAQAAAKGIDLKPGETLAYLQHIKVVNNPKEKGLVVAFTNRFMFCTAAVREKCPAAFFHGAKIFLM